jgi:hypothetical protein
MAPEVSHPVVLICCFIYSDWTTTCGKASYHLASVSFCFLPFFQVGLQEPYNQKADVYSWSMLMWYIMALEPPFGLFTPKMFLDRVFKRGYRPVVMDKWPDGINRLLKTCWSAKIDDRPDFSRIKELLRKELILINPHTTSFLAEE